MFHCAFHSAAHVSRCFAVRFTAFHRPCALSLQPKVRHGQFPTSNANLLASHDETLLRDCPRRKCLKTTHNSNSAFSSRASFQDQTRQLGPPQSRVSTAECHFCVLNCMKQDNALPITSSSQNSKVCGCKFSFPASKFQAKPSKEHTKCGSHFGSRFPTPKMGTIALLHSFLQ